MAPCASLDPDDACPPNTATWACSGHLAKVTFLPYSSWWGQSRETSGFELVLFNSYLQGLWHGFPPSSSSTALRSQGKGREIQLYSHLKMIFRSEGQQPAAFGVVCQAICRQQGNKLKHKWHRKLKRVPFSWPSLSQPAARKQTQHSWS